MRDVSYEEVCELFELYLNSGDIKWDNKSTVLNKKGLSQDDT